MEEDEDDDDDDIEEVEERVEEQLLQCLCCLYNVQLCDARKLDSHPGRGGLFSPETPVQAAALLRAIHPFIRRPARLPAALKASAFDALQQVLHHFPLPPASLCTYKPHLRPATWLSSQPNLRMGCCRQGREAVGDGGGQRGTRSVS
jgi:hypothetical protein